MPMVTTAAGQDDRALPGQGRDVVGRAREVAAIEAFLDAGDRLPRALVIEGEAGIGKTTLWHRATAGSQTTVWDEHSYSVITWDLNHEGPIRLPQS